MARAAQTLFGGNVGPLPPSAKDTCQRRGIDLRCVGRGNGLRAAAGAVDRTAARSANSDRTQRHRTQRIKTITQGRVVGTDISAGMIVQAQDKCPAIEVRKLGAESLDYQEESDVVFCNSSFQWFTRPGEAVAALRAAWRPGGRIGVSCPATENWPTCFKNVAAEAGGNADLRATFAHWKSPWFHRPDKQSYQNLFEAQGLKTIQCRIELEEKHSSGLTEHTGWACSLSS